MKNRLYFNSNPDKDFLYKKILEEKNSIGYYNLPNQDIEDILEYIQNFSSSIKSVVVVGIGGSSLGSEAIYNFLNPNKRELILLDTTDPLYLEKTLEKID